MPALPPYIPNRDSKFDEWLANFSTLITAAPGTYGLMAGDAANIAAAAASWHAAYLLVTSPTTKTAATVSAKNTSRVNTLAVVRPYAQTISLNQGVTSGNKIAVGVNPRTSTPSPITPPTTNPILVLQSAANLSAFIRYRDSAASVSVKAKPYGVTQIQIYGAASATIVTDPTTLPLKGTFQKSPLVLTFASGNAGQQFYTAARWATRTGGLSPWSPIINFTILQGG
jgi:hypothetical protein